MRCYGWEVKLSESVCFGALVLGWNGRIAVSRGLFKP